MARLADFTRYDQISTFIKRIILGSAVRILNGTFRNKSGRGANDHMGPIVRPDRGESKIVQIRIFYD